MMYQDNILEKKERMFDSHLYGHLYDKYDNEIDFHGSVDDKICENSSTWDNLIAWAEKDDPDRFTCYWPTDKEEDAGDEEGDSRDVAETLLVDFQLRLRPRTCKLEDRWEYGSPFVVNCYEGYFVLEQNYSHATFISTSLPGLLGWLSSREKIGGEMENGGKPYYTHKLQSYKGYKGQVDSDRLSTRRRHRLRGKVDSMIRMEDYKNVSSWDDIINRVDLAHYVALIYEGEWESSIAAVLLKNFGIHHRLNTELLFGTRAHDFIVYCEEGVFTINKSKKWACLISRTLPGALGYLGFEEADPEGEDKESGKPYFE